MKTTLRIGAGSAWWGDRIEPAHLNAERGELDYRKVAVPRLLADPISEKRAALR